MPTTEQHSWVSSVLGVNTDAVIGAAKNFVKSLPGSDMLPDCKPVKGKVPGPKHHLLCAAHGHVLDIKARKIIAISLEQYKSQGLANPKTPAAAPSDQKAPPASPPSAPSASQAAPASAPVAAAPSPADAAAQAQAETKKILNNMKYEIEDLEQVRAAYEEVAGGSRLNRAVSWVSDKLGGADDPGDEIGQLQSQAFMEQMQGIAAAGSQKFEEARKHLETIKTLTEKAHKLLSKYTGDTEKGAGRAVTGLEVASKAGDYATDGLNIVAPGAGKVLSIAKNVSVAGSKLAFGEKVNWAEFSIDMCFDLFVGGEGGNFNKAAEKLGGQLAKDLAPDLSKAIIKKWGDAAAKKLGAEVTEAAVEKYIVTYVEERLKDGAKDTVKAMSEKAIESAKDKDMTNGELADLVFKSMANPSGDFARTVSEQVMTAYKP
jgi:hypothetical protein